MKEFKLIRVSAAAPFERGVQYGKQATEEIAACIAFYRNKFITTRKLSWEEARDFAAMHLPDIEEAMPDLLEEAKGIADGAGVDFTDLLVLNCRYEISHFPHKEDEMECTAFALEREATAEGHVIVGQNWDMRPGLLKHAVLLDITEEETGNRILGITEAGQLLRNGMNTRGAAQCSNSLHSCFDDVGHGIPSNFVRRKLLTMDNITDMVKLIRTAGRSVSVNYCIGTAENAVADVEAVPGHCVRLSPVKGVLAHANNLIVNQDTDTYRNERFRAERLFELLYSKRGAITVDYIKECLKDHEGYPGGICNHTVEFKKPWQTIASVIYDLDARHAWICYGPPCQGEYKEFQL